MNQPDLSNLLVLALAGMLAWLSVNILLSVYKLNKSYELSPNRFIYPANCKPELCQDVAGFIGFITPRLVIFGVLGLLVTGFYLVNELTAVFSFLPAWFAKGLSYFLFVPLFIWYVIFINKAAKKFW